MNLPDCTDTIYVIDRDLKYKPIAVNVAGNDERHSLLMCRETDEYYFFSSKGQVAGYGDKSYAVRKKDGVISQMSYAEDSFYTTENLFVSPLHVNTSADWLVNYELVCNFKYARLYGDARLNALVDSLGPMNNADDWVTPIVRLTHLK